MARSWTHGLVLLVASCSSSTPAAGVARPGSDGGDIDASAIDARTGDGPHWIEGGAMLGDDAGEPAESAAPEAAAPTVFANLVACGVGNTIAVGCNGMPLQQDDYYVSFGDDDGGVPSGTGGPMDCPDDASTLNCVPACSSNATTAANCERGTHCLVWYYDGAGNNVAGGLSQSGNGSCVSCAPAAAVVASPPACPGSTPDAMIVAMICNAVPDAQLGCSIVGDGPYWCCPYAGQTVE